MIQYSHTGRETPDMKGMITMTYSEFFKACEDGKIVVYDTRSERGYVSRRLKDSDSITSGVANGRRAGEKYVLMPRYDSTNYCYRVYYKEACKQ